MLNTYEEMLTKLDYSRFGEKLYRKEVTNNIPQNYIWFKENFGNSNWVLYNTSMYVEEYGHLHMRSTFQGDLELPVNASSCRGMFESEVLLGVTLGKKFNTKYIVDMKGMFKDAKLPSNFTLGDYFYTKNVVNMDEMFMSCEMPEGFSLGQEFSMSNVKTKENMFVASNMAGHLSQEEFTKLLKETQSTLDTVSQLLAQGYSKQEVGVLLGKAEKGITDSCMKAMPKVLVKNGNTIGEAYSILIEKGFPKEIAYKCIVEYLNSQRLE